MKKSDMHFFKVEDAGKYGVNKAILLSHIRYILDHHRDSQRNIHSKDKTKYYWMFDSGSSFKKKFPYFSQRSIERWLNELTKDNVLIRGEFNKIKHDKTKWYTTTEYVVPSAKMAGHIRQNGGPIPNILDIEDISKDISLPKNEKIKKSVEKVDIKKFDNEEQINKLKNSPTRINQIIGLFFEYLSKDHHFDFKTQSEFNRYLRQNVASAKILAELNYENEFYTHLFEHSGEKLAEYNKTPKPDENPQIYTNLATPLKMRPDFEQTYDISEYKELEMAVK